MEVIFRDQTNHKCPANFFSYFCERKKKENMISIHLVVPAIIINFTEFSFLVHLQSFWKLIPLKVSQTTVIEQFQVLWEILSNQD